MGLWLHRSLLLHSSDPTGNNKINFFLTLWGELQRLSMCWPPNHRSRRITPKCYRATRFWVLHTPGFPEPAPRRQPSKGGFQGDYCEYWSLSTLRNSDDYSESVRCLSVCGACVGCVCGGGQTKTVDSGSAGLTGHRALYFSCLYSPTPKVLRTSIQGHASLSCLFVCLFVLWISEIQTQIFMLT